MLTERQVAERTGLAPATLRKWRHKQRPGAPYWVDLAHPGRNRDTAYLPTAGRPIIRYPQAELVVYMAGTPAA
ncbi:MAG: hypothetical protein PHS14_16425 [Elusimicrobia bacterium]|nr:hypothetical protein [Elusimicrobiota bacterium]